MSESILERARREAATGNGKPSVNGDGHYVACPKCHRHLAECECHGDTWEPAQSQSPQSSTGEGYRPKLYASTEFFTADFRREFLVKGVLASSEPAVLGGVKKALKSGIGIDLAVSLASATPFLGFDKFAVPKPVRVMLLNGESGVATMQETGKRISEARGVKPSSLDILWGAELPQLANVQHLDDLTNLIRKHQVKVLIVDPAYLCLLAGVRPDAANASNYFDMGPIYSQFARFALQGGATPILTIHAKKNRERKPLDLDDLTFAGIAEFARQWILLSRREDYEGDGKHRLWLNVGGSAGHSFLGELDIEEGVIDDKFQGRDWKVSVAGYQEAKREKKNERDARKLEGQQQDEWAVMRLIDDMANRNEAATVTRLRNGAGISRPRTDGALERIRQQGLIEEYTAVVAKGNNATQEATAYRRIEQSVTEC